MRSATFYLVFKRRRGYSVTPTIVRVSKNQPTLKANENAVKLRLDLPDDWWNQNPLPVAVNANQILRPIEVTAQ